MFLVICRRKKEEGRRKKQYQVWLNNYIAISIQHLAISYQLDSKLLTAMF
ncbi:hypothetical protein [Okeania sp. KiyG1]|nr:hypothetical protein [Okeania sp. KiyG1]